MDWWDAGSDVNWVAHGARHLCIDGTTVCGFSWEPTSEEGETGVILQGWVGDLSTLEEKKVQEALSTIGASLCMEEDQRSLSETKRRVGIRMGDSIEISHEGMIKIICEALAAHNGFGDEQEQWASPPKVSIETLLRWSNSDPRSLDRERLSPYLKRILGC